MNIATVPAVGRRSKGWALVERKLVAEVRSEQGFSEGVVSLFTVSETFSGLRTALGLTCQAVLLPSLLESYITAPGYY